MANEQDTPAFTFKCVICDTVNPLNLSKDGHEGYYRCPVCGLRFEWKDGEISTVDLDEKKLRAVLVALRVSEASRFDDEGLSGP